VRREKQISLVLDFDNDRSISEFQSLLYSLKQAGANASDRRESIDDNLDAVLNLAV
jgi:hypothetical protein